MLQRDYIVEMTRRFTEKLTLWLKTAVLKGNFHSIQEVEDAVGSLLDLDGASALILDPVSLTTIMELSGIADSLGAYVSYTLLRLADAYELAGDAAVAEVRRNQAAAVAEAFCCELGSVPEELAALDKEITSAQRGE